MAPCRDSKGIFCKRLENTNNNLNKGENTMKKTAYEQRMEKLHENGINVDNFFDLSLRIPLNAEVKITVNGKEMTIGQPVTQIGNGIAYGTDAQLTETVIGLPSTWDIENDPVAQKIMENGYVKNTMIFRRWIFAQTMRLLNYKSWSNPNRTGWECGVKDLYSYNYQFEMMLEEIRVLAILQKEDTEAFEERSHFFNGDVVVWTLRDYYNRLQKYINKQAREKKRCYKGQPYVKLARYGSVLIKDLREKVYNPMEQAIAHVEYEANYGTYASMYHHLRIFVKDYYNKLPHQTTKCNVWKDAFKGSGAFYSLLNAVRFHEGFITDDNGIKYYGLEADKYLHTLLDGEYKHDVWKFHELLKKMIKENDFDLHRSIAQGHNAPGTSVDQRVKKYEMF